MSATDERPAELLPARMLNEFVYCPRLFFYEHVEGVFVHNGDTRRGAEDHKRVDGGKGELSKAKEKTENVAAGDRSSEDDDAAPVDERSTDSEIQNSPSKIQNDIIYSRSVMLGSESLGVVAKLDLVEVTLEESSPIADPASEIIGPRGAVMARPVGYEAGAPREGAGDGAPDLWDTDRMQLGLQILLLRENGYACDEGVIFYRQTRQRVRFVLDAESEAWIRRTIALARTCARGRSPRRSIIRRNARALFARFRVPAGRNAFVA